MSASSGSGRAISQAVLLGSSNGQAGAGGWDLEGATAAFRSLLHSPCQGLAPISGAQQVVPLQLGSLLTGAEPCPQPFSPVPLSSLSRSVSSAHTPWSLRDGQLLVAKVDIAEAAASGFQREREREKKAALCMTQPPGRILQGPGTFPMGKLPLLLEFLWCSFL